MPKKIITTNKKNEAPPKTKFMFGMEFELFTLDQNGFIINAADRLIERMSKEFPDVDIKKECSKNLVEINTLPNPSVTNIMAKSMEDFESLLYCAEKENVVIYPFGTHPGTFAPEMHQDKRYKAQEALFGAQRFAIAGRVAGLHCHANLPRGAYSQTTKNIRVHKKDENKEKLVNAYNLFIAIDPAISTFTQSSPFYQGKRLGKDARTIMYRGGKPLDAPHGLYANYLQFGSLPSYQRTGTDLLHSITDRFAHLDDMLKKIGINIKTFMKRGSILDSNWGPIRVNPQGTLEHRGMDMNHPNIVVASALLLKYLAKAVQEKNLAVLPSDKAVEEPFFCDGKTLLIPPHTYVRFTLQKKAAYSGLADEDVYKYCNGLFKTAKSFVPNADLPLLEPIETMLKERKTFSDTIIGESRKLFGKTEELSNAQAAKLALELSKGLFKEIILMKQRLIEVGET